MEQDFKMVAKTLKGLEGVLADELRNLGARNVEPGHRMVSFEGDLEIMYKANLCCRTALRILKPFYTFKANDPDVLYDRVKEFDWASVLSLSKTFAIDSVVNSDTFTHSRFVTYRVKDAIVDWFRDRFGDKRPGVRLQDADVLINVHITDEAVTLSLDSSGESLHRRGYRVRQTEAPINEVLAAGILLLAGYDGSQPLVDPMCGSGTFLIEAAMIAANINPGIYRRGFAFEHWKDFDAELLDKLYNDDSNERPVTQPIIGRDISPAAIDIARSNIRSAGLAKYINIGTMALSQWTQAPAATGFIVTNPPYGERISAPDMDALYQMLGSKLKHIFTGWQAWIIGYRDEYFQQIGLAPSQKISLLNGALDCELRQYIIFEGNKRDFRRKGGILKDESQPAPRFNKTDRKPRKTGHEPYKKTSAADNKYHSKKQPDKKFPLGATKKPLDANLGQTPESDNPLAKRRNPNALLMIQGRTPSLPPQQGPLMRPKGWRKKNRPSDD